MSPSISEKILPQHRERQAYVYVRQSTLKQVREHQAGRENQYALVERARALGWQRDQIHIIDGDLGRSGRDSQRPGFQALVSAVSLGRVGIILAYDASRLARSNADWYALLDVAALVGALLADTAGVFDPRLYDDRLLLGLRGMLSEAELHLYRLRTDAGRRRQVEQGTYRQLLPTGLLRREDGQVIKDPDQQIQHALAVVFARFDLLGSCPKVLRSLRDEQILLPRRQTGGLHAGQLLWKRPTVDALYEILQNPAYAGAFVHGRTMLHPERRPGQRGRTVRRPLTAWTALHHGVYPAYMTWEQFMANQQRLTDNGSNYTQRLRGATREGTALLAGIVVCGHCGRQMRLTYKPKVRYFCQAVNTTHGGPSCLCLEGAHVEGAVVEAFFAALAPAELDLLEEVLAAQQADQQRVRQQHADQVARAEYEARLAQRQYLAVDPDNRLVAAELERRWEQALAAVTAAREAAQQVAQAAPVASLTPILRAQLRDVGAHLPALWVSDRLTLSQKKEVLRSLIRRVILARPVADTVEIKIVWVSGAFSQVTVHPPIQRMADLGDYPQLVARIQELSAAGHEDAAIAAQLTAEGFRRARAAGLSADQVGKVRRAHGIGSLRTTFRQHHEVEGHWPLSGLARHLQIPRKWLYPLIAQGTLPATQHPLTKHYLIPVDPALLHHLQTDVVPALHARHGQHQPDRSA